MTTLYVVTSAVLAPTLQHHHVAHPKQRLDAMTIALCILLALLFWDDLVVRVERLLLRALKVLVWLWEPFRP